MIQLDCLGFICLKFIFSNGLKSFSLELENILEIGKEGSLSVTILLSSGVYDL